MEDIRFPHKFEVSEHAIGLISALSIEFGFDENSKPINTLNVEVSIRTMKPTDVRGTYEISEEKKHFTKVYNVMPDNMNISYLEDILPEIERIKQQVIDEA